MMEMQKKTNPRWIVAKFGGTSVSTAARWRSIRQLLEGHQAEGHRSLVVCSALAGVTNRLGALLAAVQKGEDATEPLDGIRALHVALARGLGLDADHLLGESMAELARHARALSARAEVTPKDHAAVMAYGELLSTRLGAAWLREQRVPAVWHDARQMLRAEPNPEGSSRGQHYLAATCDFAPDPTLQRTLFEAAPVVVTQGFVASDASGDTVLLGRGGSDTSAAYLAAKLQAARLEIWTDVPGMFTANPSAVPEARLVPELTYREAQSLAGLGARVLHPRCLRPLHEQQIPLRLGATELPACGGTTINGFSPKTGIAAIVSRKDLCMLAMRRDPQWQPVGFMADVASCFQRHGLSMDLVSSSPSEIRVTIDTSAFPDVRGRMDALLATLREVSDAEVIPQVASLSLVGHRLLEDSERFAGAAQLLRGQNVRFVSHAADDSSLTYVLDNAAVEALVPRLHAELFETSRPSARKLGPAFRELTQAKSSSKQPPPTQPAPRPAGRAA